MISRILNDRKEERIKAFTLVEILITIAVIGILAGLIFVGTQSALANSRDARRKGEISQIKKSLQAYYNANKIYPTTTASGISLEYDSDNNLGFTQEMKGGGYMSAIPRDPKYAIDPATYTYKYIATTTDYYTLCSKSESKDGYICVTESTAPALAASAPMFGGWGGGSTVADFTTYTETDPNNHITVVASRIDFSDLGRDEDAYVYKDMGAGYFSGDFEQLVTIKYASSTDGKVAVWGMANSVDDFDNTYPFLEVRVTYNGGQGLIGVFADSSWQNLEYVAPGTIRYLKIKRVESEGATGRLYCYVYSDAARTNLIVSGYASPSAKTDYRYLYAAASHNGGYAGMPMTGYVENLDLGQ